MTKQELLNSKPGEVLIFGNHVFMLLAPVSIVKESEKTHYVTIEHVGSEDACIYTGMKNYHWFRVEEYSNIYKKFSKLGA
jgi:hypothetical protein